MSRRAWLWLIATVSPLVIIIVSAVAFDLLFLGCAARDLPDLAAVRSRELLELKHQLNSELFLSSNTEKVLWIKGRTAAILISAPISGCCAEADDYAIVWKRVYDSEHFGLDYCVNIKIRWLGGGTDVADYTGHPSL